MSNDYLILKGKSLEDTVNRGLKILNKTIDEVDIEILEEKKSIMGLKKEYQIRIKVKNQDKNDYVENNMSSIIIDDNINSSYFDIKYNEDGVHLCVLQNDKNFRISEQEVVFKLNRKKITDYDLDIVKKIVKEGKGEYTKIAPPQNEKVINAELIINIAPDAMAAYAMLLPPEGGRDLEISEVLEKINEIISYGINTEKVKDMVNNRNYNKNILIAKGKLPQDGKDGEIKYYFNTQKKVNLEVLEDGSVDLRNLNLINNVKKGDILAEIIPATEGEPGITVKGKVIPQKPGRNVVFKAGKNVETSEDSLKVISSIDGQVCLENGKISVYELYEVKGDVDNSTGNINFNGSVNVKGNVRSGFEIICKGDAEIEGVVEGATIKTEGNIILKRGVQGHFKGDLQSNGDIIAKYIENCNVKSKGDISCEVLMHSNVISGGSIDITKGKGLIVGGTCKATKEIRAKIIGSSMETSTVLEVGVDPEIRNKYEDLKKHKIDTEEQLEKLYKSINLLNRLAENDKLTEEKRKMLVNCLKVYKILNEKLKRLKKDITDLESQIELLSSGKVIVDNIVYPGVKIVIGNSVMFVKKELKKCTIFNQDGDIKVSYHG